MDVASVFAIIFIVVGVVSGFMIYLIETKSWGTEKVKTILWITLFSCIAGFLLLLFFSIPQSLE